MVEQLVAPTLELMNSRHPGVVLPTMKVIHHLFNRQDVCNPERLLYCGNAIWRGRTPDQNGPVNSNGFGSHFRDQPVIGSSHL
jgi:hypothetical protein